MKNNLNNIAVSLQIAGLCLVSACGDTQKNFRGTAAVLASAKADSIDIKAKVADATRPTIVDRKIYVQKSSGVQVRWLQPVKKADVKSYRFEISNSKGEIVLSETTNIADLKYLEPVKGLDQTHHEFIVGADLGEDKYSTVVIAVAANEVRPSEPGALVVDKTPPDIQLFIGHRHDDKACTRGLKSRTNVAARQSPFAFCAVDPKPTASGVKDICVRNRGESQDVPQANDECWSSADDILTLVLLQDGLNQVPAFARDRAGNIGRTAERVRLNVQLPPEIAFLEPDHTTLSRPWSGGETIKLRWRITDDDTNYDEIKLVVSLVKLSDHTKFKHLGCNFSNSPLWQQCPRKEISASKSIKKISSSGKTGVGEFVFAVPSNWSNAGEWVFLVTAIDKSGNAIAASTQELNAGWEVIAGRTYKGIGGSGVTIQRPTSLAFFQFDRFGRTYDTSANYKMDAFDSRACRMTKLRGSPATAFDCPDIIASDISHSPSGGYRLTRPWVYDRADDVFYTIVRTDGNLDTVAKIDFEEGKLTSLFSLDASVPVLEADRVASAKQASNFRLDNTDGTSALFFEQTSGLLVLRHGDSFYAIDRSAKVWHVLGGTRQAYPEKQEVAQKDVVLPHSSSPFAISRNGNLILNGKKLGAWANGSGFEVQYLIRGIDLRNPAAVVKFDRISPADQAGDYSLWSGFDGQVSYDDRSDRFWVSLAWRGIAYLDNSLLSSESDLSSVTWNYVFKASSSSPKELDYLSRPPAKPEMPVAMEALTYGSLYLGNGLILFQNRNTGSLLIIEQSTGRIQRAMGFPIGGEANQIAVNRRLDTPKSLHLDSSGDLIFSDYHNLQKISMASAEKTVTTLIDNFPSAPFAYDSESNDLFQTRNGKLAVSNLDDQTTQVVPGKLPYGYELTFGYSNNLQRPKVFFATSRYQATLGVVHQQYNVFQDYGARSAWPADYRNVDVVAHRLSQLHTLPYCGPGLTPCSQPNSPATGPSGGQYHDITKLHYAAGRAGRTEWHSSVGSVAFTPDDQATYICFNHRFGLVELASQRIYFFDLFHKGTTQKVACSESSVMRTFAGHTYLAGKGAVYRIDPRHIKSQNRADAAAVATTRPMFGAHIRDFLIADDYIYYAEYEYHRIIRNRLAVP